MTKQIALGLDNCSYMPKLKRVYLEHWFLQTPWRVFKFIWVVIYNLIAIVFWLQEPSDRDIIKFIEMTTLGMLLRLVDGDEPVYLLEVKRCHLRLTTGKIENFSVVYAKPKLGEPEIKSFTLNGRERQGQQLIMSVVFSYLGTAMHTKSHLFSNSLAEYIIDNKLDILMPSTITSRPLHMGLLHSPMSVITEQRGWYYDLIGRFYVHPTLRPSCLEESRNLSVLEAHPDRVRSEESPSPYIRYLASARVALQQVMDRHDLPANLTTPLFNHMIVHSTEHVNEWLYAQFRYGCILEDRPCTTMEAFRTMSLIALFCKPTTNPIFTNKIRYINNSFYKELYGKLKQLDAQFGFDFADEVNASIMY